MGVIADPSMTCIDCGRRMLRRSLWHARPDLRPGYVRPAAHGMCNSCYTLARRARTLPSPAPHPYRRRHLTDDQVARLRRMVGISLSEPVLGGAA